MKFIIFLLPFLLSSCSVGPEYKRPETVNMPQKFMEEKIQWREAKPNSDIDRGKWWEIYNDVVLNDLENKLNSHNQDIISAEHSYNAALALVSQARASYLPSIGATYDVTKQREKISNSSNTKISSSHSLGLSASWELDLWGDLGYTLKYNIAAAEASKADWASTKLSMQSSLAQYYFELRAADVDQAMLDDIANLNKEILSYTENRYKAGMMNKIDLNNAQNNYHTSKVLALSNQSSRAQYQHAIAALIGESPSVFSLASNKQNKDLGITIPLMIPSQLLERRPDIAKSEKLVMQANTKIGSAKTAFFPSITLGSSANLEKSGLGNLLSLPNLTWSLGPQLALGLFDGGSRIAQKKNADESYKSSVASYRQTVLNAFMEVEDQLASLKSLQDQTDIQNKIAKNAANILNETNNQYKAGTVDYLAVLNAKISFCNAQKGASDTIGLKRSAEIGLIKALGGGWKE